MTSVSTRARPWIIIAALFGATAVLAGAFGAHGLKAILTPEQLLTWKTASSYQLVHAVLLLALSVSMWIELRLIRLAFGILSVGILLFSGSLYFLLLSGSHMLVLLTPVGGLLLIVGWLLLLLAAFVLE
ncbi:MAG: DUF423 domain-containing protein [Proteobacteria bacterium]|nr:DUF423 domain-containing protein [Pseudomonadota bacterium]